MLILSIKFFIFQVFFFSVRLKLFIEYFCYLILELFNTLEMQPEVTISFYLFFSIFKILLGIRIYINLNIECLLNDNNKNK